MIRIKYATIEDAKLIADISRRTFYETFSAHNSNEDMEKFMNEQFTNENLIKEVGLKGNIFFFAEDDGKTLGYVRLRESNPENNIIGKNVIEIARIYVENHYIGSGVGKLLMQTCIDIARKKQKDIIWLGVWEKNLKAIRFYEKWGFEKFGTQIFLLGNDLQTDWLMKKVL